MTEKLTARVDILVATHNLEGRAFEYLSQSVADNTKKAYKADWEHFTNWCQERGFQSMPASSRTVALYLTHMAETGFKTSTMQRRVSAISRIHQVRELPSPTHTQLFKSTWSGIRRAKGTIQVGKEPALVADIQAMVRGLPATLTGTRDRALILLGFAGAFRRSELVSLNVEDLTITRDGIVVLLRRSKTDQEGEGRKVGIPYGSYPDTCPVRTVQAWLEASEINAGPIFRGINRHGQMAETRMCDHTVARIVKRSVARLGMESADYAGHSLRAGLATSAAAAGKSERSIMAQTGHTNPTMVRKYIREGSLFRDNAAAALGL